MGQKEACLAAAELFDRLAEAVGVVSGVGVTGTRRGGNAASIWTPCIGMSAEPDGDEEMAINTAW